jgi:hypothetical protein
MQADNKNQTSIVLPAPALPCPDAASLLQPTSGCATSGAWITRCCVGSGAATRPAAWAAAIGQPTTRTRG